jgi:pimeloyl-ACP methyl ester carboxylesterase
VLLDAGTSETSASFAPIEPEVAAITRVCVYDRAGLGRSDPSPQPRTSGHMVAELRALLDAAGEGPPYVTVGHSLGGLNARLFAREHPEEVIGVVLIDPAHEAMPSELDALLTPAQRQARAAAQAHAPEHPDWAATAAELADAPPLEDLPLIVLAAGEPPDAPPPGFPVDAFMAMKRRLLGELAAESPRGELIVAEDAHSAVHRERPDLVIDAIRRVVAAARDALPG